jgi:hypothetical protein
MFSDDNAALLRRAVDAGVEEQTCSMALNPIVLNRQNMRRFSIVERDRSVWTAYFALSLGMRPGMTSEMVPGGEAAVSGDDR